MTRTTRSFMRIQRHLLDSFEGRLFEALCLLCIIYLFHNRLVMMNMEQELRLQQHLMWRRHHDAVHGKQPIDIPQSHDEASQKPSEPGGVVPRRVTSCRLQNDFSSLGEETVSFGDTLRPAAFVNSNLELYLRLKFDYGWGEARSFVLTSLRLFWPHSNVVIAMDGDYYSDKSAVKKIKSHVAEYEPVTFRAVLRDSFPGLKGLPNKRRQQVRWNGYNRAQLDMMFADEVVTAKHVGFIESDTLFVGIVTPDSIFSDGRPIVVGSLSRSNGTTESKWLEAIQATEFMLKRKFVMSCMSYFPVVIITKHIKAFREFVARQHGKDFIDVYKEMFMTYLWHCHYSLMCNYLWYYHRDDYVWHFHSYVGWSKGWDHQVPGQTNDFSFLHPRNKLPVVRVATHASLSLDAGHLYGDYDPLVAAPVLMAGLCYGARAQCKDVLECKAIKKACQSLKIDVDKPFRDLFRFEATQSWLWEPRVCYAQTSYYKSVRRLPRWLPYAAAVFKKSLPKRWSSFEKNFQTANA